MKKLFLGCTIGLTTVLSAGMAPAADGPSLAPHESILASVKALRKSDTKALIHSLFTKDQIAMLGQEWDVQRRQEPDEMEAASFQAFMAQLTAPDAEQTLMAMVEPKLEEMRPQVAMMVGMFSGLGQATVAENDTLSDEDKENAARLIEAIARTLMTNDITDAGSARKAISVLCKAARKLDVDTLEEIQALSFDQLLAKGDIVLHAVKGVMAVYGLSVDSWLDTFSAETIEQCEDHATVRVHFEILGIRDSSEYEMVKVGDRWIREEVTELPMGF